MRFDLIAVMLALLTGCIDMPTGAGGARQTAPSITSVQESDRITVRMMTLSEGGGEVVREFQLPLEHLQLTRPLQATGEVFDRPARVDAGERFGVPVLRFRRAMDGVTETWLFDEEIGAVVERVTERAGRPRVSIRYEYSASPDGHELVRTISDWTEADGRSVRRLEIDYSGGQP
jgi:hypothetical protein